MESYSSSYSSSKSSYISKNPKKTNGTMKHEYPFESHNYSWLHSVRKSPAKTWNKKAPIAPMAPTPIKVYKVDPINFKELVQSLTCAPQFMPQQPHQNLDLESTTDHTTASGIVPSDEEEVMTPGLLEMKLFLAMPFRMDSFWREDI